MAFTGEENHDINLAEAAKMTKKFRTKFPTEVKAYFISKSAIQNILNQANCVGLRIYYGIDDQGAKHLVFVGVNAEENDLYHG